MPSRAPVMHPLVHHAVARAMAVAIAACLWLAMATAPAMAQTFPALSGRVVDAANLIPPGQEADLTARLAALETRSGRQLVVATVPDLEGMDVADYGRRLGDAWAIGDKERDDGVIFLIAPNERRMTIQTGYGIEPVLTDTLSGRIIRDQVTPRFKAGDYVGGIDAGVTAISQQLELPPEEALARAQAAERSAARSGDGGNDGAFIFWVFVLIVVFILLASNSSGGGGGRRGRRYRSNDHWGAGPIIIWGGGNSGWGGGGGFGGGGFGGGGFGGGGFGGGGGSFGGGGASGGW